MAFSSWITTYLTAKAAGNITFTSHGSGGYVLQARDLEVGGLNRVLSASVISSPGAYVAAVPPSSLQNQLTALAARVQTAAGTLSTEIDTDVAALSGSAKTDRQRIQDALQVEISSSVANLVDGAPATLNTLKEIATSLANDASLSSSLATTIGSIRSQLGGTAISRKLTWASASHASGGSALKFGVGTGCARMKVKVENAANDVVSVTFDVQ